jgi:hypothetical protein
MWRRNGGGEDDTNPPTPGFAKEEEGSFPIMN